MIETLRTDEQASWYALHVRSRYEKIACEILSQKGYETFLPTYQAQRQWSDRRKTLNEPLFPSYLFCQFNSLRRSPILSTTGVRSIVGNACGPLAVDPSEIESIRVVVESGMNLEPVPYLVSGERVQIDRGALTGLEGVVVDLKGKCRVTVSMTLLNRSVAVEVDLASIRALSPQQKSPPVKTTATNRVHPSYYGVGSDVLGDRRLATERVSA